MVCLEYVLLTRVKGRFNLGKWSLYFAIFVAIVVGILRFQHGYEVEDLLIQSTIIFCLIFALLEFIAIIFKTVGLDDIISDNITNPKAEPIEEEPVKASHLRLVKNNLTEQETQLSGQVEPSLAEGLPNNQQRNEIKQKMGL